MESESLGEDDSVSATAVDSHAPGTQSHTGSFQDLIEISRFQSNERVLRTLFYERASSRSRESRQCPSVIDLAIPVSAAAEISQAEVIILRAHQIQHFRQERECLV